jgi:hypothetical protein
VIDETGLPLQLNICFETKKEGVIFEGYFKRDQG